MTFILAQKPSYTWPVKYTAAGDNGKTQSSDFLAEFKRLPQSRLDEIYQRAQTETIDDEAFIAEILLGWSGIKDADGQDVPFNDLHRRVLLDLPGMRAAIVDAFFHSIRGAPRKN